MSDFIAATDRGLLDRHGLADFDALWDMPRDIVGEPGTLGSGWSRVDSLELEASGFYLKRQSNYLVRSAYRPLGEPSFAREFRMINRYQSLGIPSLYAVFYGERKVKGERRAILMTRALDGWVDLDALLQQWSTLNPHQHLAILRSCGQLARTLHSAGQVHGCFCPRHVFLRSRSDAYQAQLIGLEKTRPALFGWRDRIRDLESLLRQAPIWNETEVRDFLATYLQAPVTSTVVNTWWRRLVKRRSHKEVL
ncbi:lipopolysaccharide kinase InaA family protein [Pseudomonas sp. MH9.2]|uniref:lipopolysaccharide kinase InaA family protein n=1 Tax=unclassified Pseudomonas TaxID=196821 RepID=UPI002AC8D302|nr:MULTISPECIES: lipopolysaccharide kinase InaA family protein [unclassified Pseudomonas]MEB0007795.1 lipopolysaccharide kinase InaA family protein [Pseudomonas sp. RTB2]MEB0019637.1 lipopolysaccharide kinase InaA family protein [Pseudomonas sp. RTB3]MEB0028022.1 lipopolysaccharide kinase InaA family protein [Pseudomonas sp. MH9.2]MEB0150079.1 lipopolysaccharide kinase InaA family protein [Pseudomonas sp. CCC2.2]MEB0272223.1 lipopolysaccharide kinase InaA family protein [Pseudomonas sp. 5B4]